MVRAYLTLGAYAVAVDCPDALGDTVISMMGLERVILPDRQIMAEISVERFDGGRYRIRSGEEVVAGNMVLGDAVNAAWRQAVLVLAAGFSRPSIILHAASLIRNGAAVVIPGRSGRGKSSLTAWLVRQGYDHLSDDVASVRQDGWIEAVMGPLLIRADVWPLIERLDLAGDHLELEGGGRLIQPRSKTAGASVPHPCSLILLPAFSRKSPPGIELVSPARAAMALMAQNHSAPETQDHGLSIALAAARGATTLKLTYGSFEEIEGVVQPLLDKILSGELASLQLSIDEANEVLARRRSLLTTVATAGSVPATAVPLPEATPRRDIKPRLTIGMPTFNDYDGVYFSIQALRLYHPEVMDETEIVVVDNNPAGDPAPLLKKLDTEAPNYRYIPYTAKGGSAPGKEQIFAEASGTFVLGIDCHVLIVPGALRRLIDYFNARPDTNDLIQGPLLYDDLNSISTHWDPAWRGGMFGTWATDDRARDVNGPPFEIPMSGMGLFACRRDAWPHFNPQFRGFGGEEGYIHEKFRQAGHKTLCLPFLRWVHRFGRPGGAPYVNTWEDRIHNYYVGHRELGLDTADMEAHFSGLLGKEVFERIQTQLGFAPAKSVEPV